MRVFKIRVRWAIWNFIADFEHWFDRKTQSAFSHFTWPVADWLLDVFDLEDRELKFLDTYDKVARRISEIHDAEDQLKFDAEVERLKRVIGDTQ